MRVLPYLPATNEPVLDYRTGSEERRQLESSLAKMLDQETDIPMVIDGKAVRTDRRTPICCPHEHRHVLGTAEEGGPAETRSAIDAAIRAQNDWSQMTFASRAAIFLRAAELLTTKYRPILNASTILGQSKTAHQAEIDAVCELADFFRFNVKFAEDILSGQCHSSPGCWNYLDYRPLEGFVLAVTPFNFTSIAANLAAAPALMGNTVVWKPSDSQKHSAHYLMQLFSEAGLPDGVINMVFGPAEEIVGEALSHPALAGVHFTGSTAAFQSIWQRVGANIGTYRSYPRLVGETGGKDFIVAHRSADADVLITAILRGAFEYQGQKCSAASRLYIPTTLYQGIKDRLIAEVEGITMGNPLDFSNFMAAVINDRAFEKISQYIHYAGQSTEAEVIAGGQCDKTTGYFVRPTLIETKNPAFRTMNEEIFGPVLTIFPYPDDQFEQTLELCNQTSPFGLTGAIFSRERSAISMALNRLRYAAGNFYINDKPTGAVVGQQPFGGSRASGTNDKAGSKLNLLRWLSVRTVKENFNPPQSYRYPFMD